MRAVTDQGYGSVVIPAEELALRQVLKLGQLLLLVLLSLS